ncbi:MAG: hypothetical protein LUG60_09345 [Erysipelotrichaceae bacterium]|nr:hypothetical protein [Erysipelotrichaceae bacterium]
MPMEKALNEQMQINDYNEYIPACKCIYTVFEANEEGTFARAFYENVYNKINKNMYTIEGNPVGRLVMKAHDKDGLHRYFEVWIPIEEL